jgi:hypothetical protein
VILPGVLIRLFVLAVLFRSNSPKKWRLALGEELLAEPLLQWLGIDQLEDLAERALASISARTSGPTVPTCTAKGG